jgi:hypothetical protein
MGNLGTFGVLELGGRVIKVDSLLFVPATGGLDVDAIPNEITTRIILDSSKSSILAQAINIGAKGVK